MNAAYPVSFAVDYPERQLDRLTSALRIFTVIPIAIPHYIELALLYVGAFFAVVAAWVMILATGRYPRPIFDYIEGVIRWHNRVIGYAFVLVTDAYPPFQLRE